MDATESQYSHPALTATGGAPGVKTQAPKPWDAQGTEGATAPRAGGKEFKPFGEDGLTFADFLDVINPLQHIPVVATIYRHVTGDGIDPVPRLAGGALFGGPLGLLAAMVNMGLQQETGRDAGEHVIALLEGAFGQDDGLDVKTAAGPDGPAGDGGPGWLPDTLTDDAPWTLATAAGPGVLLAAAPAAAADPGGAVQAVNLASHPVQEHIEVLEWAQREAALARQARAPVPARAAGAAAVSPMPSPVATQSTAAIAVPPGVRRADSADEAAWGGVAVQGGWFADTMLDALRKYQQGARLADRAAGADMARDH